MPVYKEGNTWRALVSYYKNGERIQNQKRGFKTKKDAMEWEREGFNKRTLSLDMKFQSLYEIYIKDLKHRVKNSTFEVKKIIFENRILPFFRDKKMSEVSPRDIREFHTFLMKSVNPKTKKPYSSQYMKKINAQLSALFNYAVSYYSLKENPCQKAGSIKNTKKDINIWTLQEFNAFLKVIEHKPISYAGFNTLFWTGMRIGEMLALTRKDIDLEKNTIRINKNYSKIGGNEVVSAPKTESSVRTIGMHEELSEILKEYFEKIYNLRPNDRVFNVTQYVFRNDIERHHKKAGVKKIRVHDLRHSHASYLVNMNVNPLAISKRLGHAKVEMTLNTYSHLYPTSEKNILDILNKK